MPPTKKIFSQSDFDVAEFNDQLHPRIKIQPKYFELGFSPTPQIFGRQAVKDRLIKALDLLPLEYGLLVWDVYRPREVQAKLFDWMRDEIRNKFPKLTDQENFEETRKYVALPSKVGEEYCAPHLSGGAIDLTLYEISTAAALEMGTPFDDCTPRAHSHYFDAQLSLTEEEKGIQKRRKLLRETMENVGFVHYQYEWWHFDIGDIAWSKKTGNPAVFGPLFGDLEWLGE